MLGGVTTWVYKEKGEASGSTGLIGQQKSLQLAITSDVISEKENAQGFSVGVPESEQVADQIKEICDVGGLQEDVVGGANLGGMEVDGGLQDESLVSVLDGQKGKVGCGKEVLTGGRKGFKREPRKPDSGDKVEKETIRLGAKRSAEENAEEKESKKGRGVAIVGVPNTVNSSAGLVNQPRRAQ
jgi:hypothetical protein